MFKDSKVVVFSMNDIKHWHGKEILNHTRMQVPAVIVTYNYFMNSVDRMDEVKCTGVVKGKMCSNDYFCVSTIRSINEQC